MKATIDLPDELLLEAKLRAVAQGRPLKDLVADFFRQGLGMGQLAANDIVDIGGPITLTADGLPLIRCGANAPARRYSVRQILALEQQAQTDEDLLRAGHPV